MRGAGERGSAWHPARPRTVRVACLHGRWAGYGGPARAPRCNDSNNTRVVGVSLMGSEVCFATKDLSFFRSDLSGALGECGEQDGMVREAKVCVLSGGGGDTAAAG